MLLWPNDYVIISLINVQVYLKLNTIKNLNYLN